VAESALAAVLALALGELVARAWGSLLAGDGRQVALVVSSVSEAALITPAALVASRPFTALIRIAAAVFLSIAASSSGRVFRLAHVLESAFAAPVAGALSKLVAQSWLSFLGTGEVAFVVSAVLEAAVVSVAALVAFSPLGACLGATRSGRGLGRSR